MREYAAPRLSRQRVMRGLLRLCITAPRSNDELAKLCAGWWKWPQALVGQRA